MEPQVIESTVNFSGGGKVQIMSYGRVTSDYHASITRKYRVPDDWSENQVKDFELTKIAELRAELEPILDAEFEERWSQKVWNE